MARVRAGRNERGPALLVVLPYTAQIWRASKFVKRQRPLRNVQVAEMICRRRKRERVHEGTMERVETNTDTKARVHRL